MPPTLTIAVLGDSACASTGGHFPNHIDMLARSAWDRPLRVLNPSAVGVTASDALLHYCHLSAETSLDAVIIYLGNCDACSYGPLKPRRKPWSPEKIQSFNRGKKLDNPLSIRNKPFCFESQDLKRNVLTRCVPPRDYEAQLKDLIADCLDKGVKVILVAPASKPDYPPCNNIGNFPYYKIFGIEDALPLRPNLSAKRLTQAIERQQQGDAATAEEWYQGLAAARHGEIAAIAVNNLASLRFDQGELDGAEQLLATISEKRNPLYPIILFNRAVVAQARGDEPGARDLFARARDLDMGTYRVTGAYTTAARSLSRRFGHKIWTIDLDALVSPADFVDYCHPSTEACARILQELERTLKDALGLSTGNHHPAIEFTPLNPDAYTGAGEDFFRYYGFLVSPDNAFPDDLIQAAEATAFQDILARNAAFEPDQRQRTMLAILVHPLFGLPGFLRAVPPDAPSDQGRLPELYFLRLMLRLHGFLAAEGFPGSLPGALRPFFPDVSKLLTWLPEEAPAVDLDRMRGALAALDWNAALDRATELVRFHLANEPACFNRIRSISYWFFRESMVFGTASHHFALLDRLSIKHALDACLAALWFLDQSHPARPGFEALVARLGDILAVHDRYLLPWAHRLHAMPGDVRKEYREDLAALRQAFEGVRPAQCSSNCIS